MTKIYGASDDLIEFDGDVRGEVGASRTDDRPYGDLIVCSDGTILEVKYGKNDDAIWEVKVRHKGALLKTVDLCDDADADPYSDVAHFEDGLKWAYTCSEWERVK